MTNEELLNEINKPYEFSGEYMSREDCDKNAVALIQSFREQVEMDSVSIWKTPDTMPEENTMLRNKFSPRITCILRVGVGGGTTFEGFYQTWTEDTVCEEMKNTGSTWIHFKQDVLLWCYSKDLADFGLKLLDQLKQHETSEPI